MHTTYIQQKLFEAGSVGTLHTWTDSFKDNITREI